MKSRRGRLFGSMGIAIALISCASQAQVAPQFSLFRLLTNKEAALGLDVDIGSHYRIDVSTNLPAWVPLVMLTGSAVTIQHTDSAAPWLGTRYYRAEKVAATNMLGDYLLTTNGDVIIQTKFHATFVMRWNGKMIYNDPDNTTPYASLPKADLILLSHILTPIISTFPRSTPLRTSMP